MELVLKYYFRIIKYWLIHVSLGDWKQRKIANDMLGSEDGKSKKNNEWVTCWERYNVWKLHLKWHMYWKCWIKIHDGWTMQTW